MSATKFDDAQPNFTGEPLEILKKEQEYWLGGADFWQHRIPGRTVTEEHIGPQDSNAGFIYAVDSATGATKWVRAALSGE